MNCPKPWRPGLLTWIVVACVCPLVARTILPRETTSIAQHTVRDEADPKDIESCRTMGELDIAYSSENHGAPIVGLVVTDPRGRKIGQDLLSHKLWQELPLAQAFIDCDQNEETGETRACHGSVQICGPVSGTYKIEAIATQSGNYSVSATGSSAQLISGKRLHSSDSEAGISRVAIQKGSRQTLLLTYSRQPGAKLGLMKAEAPSVAGNR